MISANHFSPLSFSPVGEMQVTPYIEGVSMPRVSVPPLRGRLGGGWSWKAVHIYHDKLLRQWFHQSLQPPLVLPRWGDVGYSELSKTGWYRLLRIAKDRLVQVKDRLVQVTLVDVSNVSFHRDFCAVLGTVLAHLGQARYPTWASTLPHLGTFAARKLPICPQ